MKASVKYMVIYRHREKYSISEMCRFFEVSRSGYYDYVKRMDTPDCDTELVELIRTCQKETYSTYGYRRVQIWLDKRKNIRKNPKIVLRIMQKYHLLSVIHRKRYRKYGESLHRYPKLLNRDFHADRPNQKWATAISYIKTGQGFLYLSIIHDLYDNSIVAYRTGTEQNNRLVLDTVRDAMEKEKVTDGLALHSDQGFQYTSHKYFKLTRSYNIFRLCQDVGTHMTTLWRKIFSRSSKRSVFIDSNSIHLKKPML